MSQSPQQIANNAALLDSVAELLSLGLETPDIAERLGIKRHTVSNLVGKIRAKYGSQAQ